MSGETVGGYAAMGEACERLSEDRRQLGQRRGGDRRVKHEEVIRLSRGILDGIRREGMDGWLLGHGFVAEIARRDGAEAAEPVAASWSPSPPEAPPLIAPRDITLPRADARAWTRDARALRSSSDAGGFTSSSTTTLHGTIGSEASCRFEATNRAACFSAARRAADASFTLVAPPLAAFAWGGGASDGGTSALLLLTSSSSSSSDSSSSSSFFGSAAPGGLRARYCMRGLGVRRRGAPPPPRYCSPPPSWQPAARDVVAAAGATRSFGLRRAARKSSSSLSDSSLSSSPAVAV